MSYTYNPPADGIFGNPEVPDDVSHIRYLVRDTAPAAPHSLQDEEIQYLIAQWRISTENPAPAPVDVYTVAAWVAYDMADTYTVSSGTSRSKSVGNVSLSETSSGREYRNYRTLGDRLLARGVGGGAYSGMGLVGSQNAPAIFSIGMMDNGGGGDPLPTPYAERDFHVG